MTSTKFFYILFDFYLLYWFFETYFVVKMYNGDTESKI